MQGPAGPPPEPGPAPRGRVPTAVATATQAAPGKEHNVAGHGFELTFTLSGNIVENIKFKRSSWGLTDDTVLTTQQQDAVLNGVLKTVAEWVKSQGIKWLDVIPATYLQVTSVAAAAGEELPCCVAYPHLTSHSGGNDHACAPARVGPHAGVSAAAVRPQADALGC